MPSELNDIQRRLKNLGLYGLLSRFSELVDKPWLTELLDIEEQERKRRSLERRVRNARISAFKPMADFDWTWPRRIDREAVEELFGLGFVDDGSNIVLLGPNGVGKSMILKNVCHHALVRGYTVRFTTASDMLADLARQETTTTLSRRVGRYTLPQLLCIDEVGYLSYDNRYADLLFEVVTRRYEAKRPIVLSTNKAFEHWTEVFPHAACVVTLVDRLIHRAEIIQVDADSYRLKEAKQLAKDRGERRRSKKKAA